MFAILFLVVSCFFFSPFFSFSFFFSSLFLFFFSPFFFPPFISFLPRVPPPTTLEISPWRRLDVESLLHLDALPAVRGVDHAAVPLVPLPLNVIVVLLVVVSVVAAHLVGAGPRGISYAAAAVLALRASRQLNLLA